MTRYKFQFQIGYHIFQLDTDVATDWPAQWPTGNVLAWMKMKEEAGIYYPELLMRRQDYAYPETPQCRLRPEQLLLSTGDPDTGEWAFFVDLETVNSHASPPLYGAQLQLMSGAYSDDDYHPYLQCSPGFYGGSGYTMFPSVVVRNCVFTIPDADWPGDSSTIPSGGASLRWDDVNHQLLAVDHDENEHVIGP